MEFSFDKHGSTGVYTLKGNLIGEKDGISITESYSENLDDKITHYVIDLGDLQHINSAGLGVLITLLTKARKAGGEVYLSNPSDYIGNLLLITKLNTIFQIFPSLEEALDAFEAKA